MVKTIFKSNFVFSSTKNAFIETKFIVKDEKIVKVDENIEETDNTKIINYSDNYITPGLIDCHTHLGLANDGTTENDTNEMSFTPITPEVRAIDGLNINDLSFFEAIKGGITSVGVLPGSGNLIGGQGVAIKTWNPQAYIGENLILEHYIGQKMALGENPKSVYGKLKKMPTTRMGSAAVIRKTLLETLDYIREWKHYEEQLSQSTIKDKKPKAPKTNLGLEALTLILQRIKPVRMHAHRADDIATAIRLSEEFGFDLIIDHCSEGHRLVDYLKNKNIMAVIGPTMGFRTKKETREKTFRTYGLLEKEKVEFAITSDHPVTHVKYLNIYAGLAHVEGGMTETGALKAITEIPAKILGLSNRVGKIAENFDADFVIWEDNPMNSIKRPIKVFINGKLVYDKEVHRENEWERFASQPFISK